MQIPDTESGLPLVFLHAFPLNRRMWAAQQEALAPRFSLALDLPGFGDRSLVEPKLEAYAGDVADQLDTAGITRAAFVGLSMGGYVLLRLLALDPKRVAALVLADTRVTPDTPVVAGRRDAQIARVRAEGLGWLPEVMLSGLLGSETRSKNPALVQQVDTWIREADPLGIEHALLAMRDRPDSTSLLSRIRVPTLVLAGEQDILTPPGEALTTARAMQAHFKMLSGAGHLSNLEAPAAFNAALAVFLKEAVDGYS